MCDMQNLPFEGEEDLSKGSELSLVHQVAAMLIDGWEIYRFLTDDNPGEKYK
jgi:hypothetical protein